MQDRVPLYPGRVTLTPVEGQENTYDMVRADQPTQAGTPLSKANLLKDSTAAMYVGAGVNVPDDALAYVGKFAQYWWRLQRGEAYTIYKEQRTTYSRGSGDYLRFYVKNRYIFQYSSQISIDQETGTVSLVDPVTYTEPASTGTGRKKCEALRDELCGKYVTGMSSGSTVYSNDTGTRAADIFYIPENATAATGKSEDKTFSFSTNDDGNIFVFLNGAIDRVDVPGMVVGTKPEVVPPDQPTYAQSSDRNAYPDSGTVDGVTYTYLGVPFDNFMTPARIETGTYYGTGGAGSESPNIISTPSTPFAAKAIFIQSAKSEISGESLFATDAGTTGVFYGSLRMDGGGYSNATAYNAFAFSPDHVSWYLSSMIPSMSDFTAAAHASAQMNTSGTLYRYLIIG